MIAYATIANFRRLQPWLVCFSAALFFFYEFIQMNMFNSISKDLMHDFHLGGTTLGYLSATYFLGDVFFLFPAGIILDRISVKKVISIALLLCIIGTLIFASTTNFYIAAAAHFAAGIGNAFSFLSCVLLATRWFPPNRMALVTGLIVTFAMAGGMVAQTPLTLLSASIGWRKAIFLNAALGLIIFFIILFFVKDFPSDSEHLASQQKKTLSEMGLLQSIQRVLTNKQNWLGGLYTSLFNMPIMVLGALWGAIHLVGTQNLSPTQASTVSSMIFLGTIFGSPFLGYLSDQIRQRRKPMFWFGLLSLFIVTLLMIIPPIDYIILLGLYFALGFFTSAQVLSYPLIAESNLKSLTGTAMGIASVIIMGGGAISQPLFGWLLDWHWDHQMKNGTPLFSAQDFHIAFMMLPIAFIIGLIATYFIKETYCQPVEE